MKEIYILGNKITALTSLELNKEIGNIIEKENKELILNVNVHGLNLANKIKWLKNFRNSSYMVFCDGQGVIFGAKLLKKNIPERIPVTDWLWNFCEFCEKNQYSLFFLGTTQNNIETAKVKLLKKYPKLKIKGVHHGFFEKNGKENKKIIRIINERKPDILIVSFGMPLQEKWLKENWKKIEAKVFLVGGACFDYASGSLKRGPAFLVNNGLEWLCRLLIEPKRLWRRYIIGNTQFYFQIFKELIHKKN